MGKRGKNEGSIYQRKDGRWVALMQIGWTPNGNRRFVTYYGKTRREVATKLENSLSEVNKRIFIEPSKITYEEWLWTWMETYKRTTVSESTYARYISLIHNHILPNLSKIKLQDIKPMHIQKVYNICVDKNLSGSAIKHIHTVFKQSLEQAINQDLIYTNPAQKTIRPPIRHKLVSSLTLEQQQRLLSVLGDDTISTLIKLAMGTGARLGELLGLKWENIDFDNMEIHIVQGLVRAYSIDNETHKVHHVSSKLSKLKTDSSLRTIPLTNYLAKTLKKYRREQNKYINTFNNNIASFPDLVFLSESGTYLDPSNVRKKYAKFLKEADIPFIKFHALRHTFTTRILEANVHPKIAQDLLGHSTSSTTLDIYSHVLPNQKREAIAKLEGII